MARREIQARIFERDGKIVIEKTLNPCGTDTRFLTSPAS
jgi:hypothetical protein